MVVVVALAASVSSMFFHSSSDLRPVGFEVLRLEPSKADVSVACLGNCTKKLSAFSVPLFVPTCRGAVFRITAGGGDLDGDDVAGVGVGLDEVGVAVGVSSTFRFEKIRLSMMFGELLAQVLRSHESDFCSALLNS